MKKEHKIILKNRTKSFLWRLGSMVGVAVLAFLGENIGLFELPIWAVTMFGLLSGEITKYLNTTA